MNQVKELAAVEQMIQRQIIDRGIHDARVLDALRKVPRDRFFPADLRQHAYADRAAPIGHGQTISQPYIVALMTQKLDVRSDHRVLELGTGSGYQTAVLAQLAGEVYTIERVKPLLDEAWERLMDLNLRNVHFRYADGGAGWPEAAPFDRVLIAAAAPALPQKLLLSNLKDGGLAVLPVGPDTEQTLVEVRKTGHKLDVNQICPVRFVKLIGEGGFEAE